ncbi:primosomal protein N' [Dermatophilus congolensis]|uniref:primosomal protein N' n=1 Tax=Dermatophilus congolensis TaxID=1863 RepID=UPI001FBBB0A6|nr:primosomal protein N' [Dermatophilus congolensis]
MASEDAAPDLLHMGLDLDTGPVTVTKKTHEGVPLAPENPVARVVVSLGLPQLDQTFDYLVPATMDHSAQPGVRVCVPFSGRELNGFLIERTDTSDHHGSFSLIRRVVGSEQVLTPEILTLAQKIAHAHAGTLDDVLRLAIPPRHATAERDLPLTRPNDPAPLPPPTSQPWQHYPAGEHLLRHLREGDNPAAAWVASPGLPHDEDWPYAFAHLAAATLSSGRGALIVAPDHRDVATLDTALTAVLGPDQHVCLTASQGPSARYTAWLKVLRGHVRCVVGTRAAAFAPVTNLGLVAWWSDGDHCLAEPHAPYPHVRDILRTRRELNNCALFVGGWTRTTHTQAWINDGWIHPISEDPTQRRHRAAPITIAGEHAQEERYGPGAHARIPSLAWRAAKAALAHGPVLVHVPRRGYVPSIRCTSCALPARCPDCHGPLSFPTADAPPTCRWCATTVPRYQCPDCHGFRLRATVIGSERTAEELGLAFPGVPVRFSVGADIKDSVPPTPALVVATPGAEPAVDGGYAATIILDAWSALGHACLDVGEEALSRWMSAAALTRPRSRGGRIVLAGVPDSTALTPVEAFVRWAPEWFSSRELADRCGLDLPPLMWPAKLTGNYGALTDALNTMQTDLRDTNARVFGPDLLATGESKDEDTPVSERPAVALVTCDLEHRERVAALLAAMRATRAARQEPQVRVRVGDADLEALA